MKDDFENERARHGHFFAREDVIAEVRRLLFGARPLSRGWVVLSGSPGVGKSALLVHLLETLQVRTAHHFIRRGIDGRDRPEVVVQNLCAQIEQQFPGCGGADQPLEARLGGLLKQVSNDVLVPQNERLILVLDGLDELAVSSPNENPLPRFLPEILPTGVVILCATRPRHPHLHWLERRGGVHRIDLNDRRWSASNEAACRAFWEDQRTQLSPPLDRAFVEEAIWRAGGNLLHAILLRDWLLDQPIEQRVAMNIPQGLGGFFQLILDDILHLDPARRELVLRGLGVACAALEALPAYLFGEILGWSRTSDVEEFLLTARPFLVEESAHWHGGKKAYRLFHESFREFLIDKLGKLEIRKHHERIAERLAAWPPGERDTPERTYALRHAVAHRLAAGDVSAAQRLCTDVGYLEMKCCELDAAAVERDLEATARALGGAASMDLEAILAAVSAEARNVRRDPGSLPTLLFNRLVCVGWLAGRIEKVLLFSAGRPAFRLLYRVRLGATQIRAFVEHDKPVVACDVTPNGRYVLSASTDGTVRLWLLGSGECIRVLRGHDGEVTACALIDGGKKAISTSVDATAKLWDLDSERCINTLPNDGRWATACAATPDGRCIVIGSDDGSLRVWDGRSNQLERTLPGHTDYITACAVTSDGAVLISASRDGSVRAWNLSSGACLYTLQGDDEVKASVPRGMDERRWVTALALTPDGRRAYAAFGDGSILSWSVASVGRRERFPVAEGRIDACAVTRDGLHLVCGIADGTLVIWSLTAMKRVDRLSAHAAAVSACSLTPDGRRVVSASHDHGLKLWELSAPKVFPEEAHAGPVTACAAALEGLVAVSASEDRKLKLWSLTTGAPGIPLEGHADLVTACAISHDGRYVASGARDGELRVWEVASGACIRSVPGDGARVSGCAITRDGRLVTVSYDRTVRVWKLETLEPLEILGSHEDAVEGCAITLSGAYFLSLSRDGALKLWNLATGTCERSVDGLGSGLLCGALTPDGQRAVLGRDDGTIEIYDLRRGQPLYLLREHEGRVFGCAVSPDGARLVSASEDRTVRVYDLAKYTYIGRLQGARWFRCVVATKTRICAGDEEGNLWVIMSGGATVRGAKTGSRAPRKSELAASSDLRGPGGPKPMKPFIPLRDVLANLYEDPDEAKIVASRVGLDLRRIDLSGKPNVFWYEILVEAYKQDCILQLWQAAREEFPQNPELIEVGRRLGFLDT